jgi:hypothetical protein
MVEIGLIFSTAKTVTGLAQSVARLLGIVQSLEAKVDRLISSELNAGYRNLEQAYISQNETLTLLREARNSFSKAIDLETGLRQGLALIGLALCHYHLDDDNNYQAALEELVSLPPAISEWSVVASTLRRRLPGSRYEAISGLFSAAARQSWKNEQRDYLSSVVMSAVLSNPEAKALLDLQQEVGKFINLPVKWPEDLEHGRFTLP